MSARPAEPLPEPYWRAKRHRPAGAWLRFGIGFASCFLIYWTMQGLMDTYKGAKALAAFVVFTGLLAAAVTMWRRFLAGRARAHLARGGPPWEVDRAWDRAGETNGPWVRVLAHPTTWAIAAVAAAATREDVFIFRARGGTWLGVAALSVLVVGLAWAGWRGGATVQYGAFPLRTGGPVVFDVATSTGGPSASDVRCILRCVTTQFKGATTGTIVRHSQQDLEHGMGPDEFARVVFDVPADAPGSDLLVPCATHWELVVLAQTTRAPMCEVFIVPVYAAERAP